MSKKSKAPASPAAIHYRVCPADLTGHHFEVELTIEHPSPEGQVLWLPVWIPGSYMIREFARQIETFEARCGKRRVACRQLDKHRWQLAPCRGSLHIRLWIYAWDLSVRTAFLDDERAFFNGSSLLPAVSGQESAAVSIELAMPDDPRAARWRAWTTLEAVDVSPNGFGRYAARNYDDLIDHPVECAETSDVRWRSGGAEHIFVLSGRTPGVDLERLGKDASAICDAQIRFFDPENRRAAFTDVSGRYVFQTHAAGDAYGGLEHRSSTALLCSRRELPSFQEPGNPSDAYRGFLGLLSHEYFHTWWVKRVKPQAFVPYQLSQESYTRLLWVFEGFTSYYDDLMLLRAGVIDADAYLKQLENTVNSVLRFPGWKTHSLAQSSLEAWTKYYRPDENSPNHVSSYYAQGALVAFCLDQEIRQRSGDQKSLDDVLRYLWREFGVGFYARSEQSGLPEDGLAAAIAHATHLDLGDWLTNYTETARRPPIEEAMSAIGMKLQAKGQSVSLQARWNRQSDDTVKLTVVPPGSAAHQAGLAAHDILVAINGLKVSAARFEAQLQRYRPRTTVRVHAFRGDVLKEFDLTLAAEGLPEFSLLWDPTLRGRDPKLKRRNAWMHGESAARKTTR